MLRNSSPAVVRLVLVLLVLLRHCGVVRLDVVAVLELHFLLAFAVEKHLAVLLIVTSVLFVNLVLRVGHFVYLVLG